jgi:hypothetical protein
MNGERNYVFAVRELCAFTAKQGDLVDHPVE